MNALNGNLQYTILIGAYIRYLCFLKKKSFKEYKQEKDRSLNLFIGTLFKLLLVALMYILLFYTAS